MRLYAVAAVAQRLQGARMEIDYNALAFCAASDDEAQGRAIRESRRIFPAEQGYYGHAAVVCHVTKDIRERADADD